MQDTAAEWSLYPRSVETATIIYSTAVIYNVNLKLRMTQLMLHAAFTNNIVSMIQEL